MYIEMRSQFKGTSPAAFMKDVKFKFGSICNGMEKMANEARDMMREKIVSRKKRETRIQDGINQAKMKLEDAILSYVEGPRDGSQPFTVGVGLIPYLQANAPHYRLINYGGMVAPGAQRVMGRFSDGRPRPGKRGTQGGSAAFYWNKGAAQPGEQYYMEVKSPIAPFRYYDETVQWWHSISEVRMNRWTRPSSTVHGAGFTMS